MNKLRKVFGSTLKLNSPKGDHDTNNIKGLFQYKTDQASRSNTLEKNTGSQDISYVNYGSQSLSPSHTSHLVDYSDPTNTSDPLFNKLHKWAYFGDVSKVKKFVKKINVNSQDAEGRVPLHLAAASGHIEVILVLMGTRADPELEDQDGRTPFLIAVERNQIEIVQVFLQYKVNSLVTDHAGNGALHLASRTGAKDVLEILLDSGLKCEASNVLNQTPLHVATENLNLDAVHLLLANGTRVDAADKEGVTSLMLASKLGYNQLVDVLINAGADASTMDSSGWNAASYAKYSMHEELEEKLVNVIKRNEKTSDRDLMGARKASTEPHAEDSSEKGDNSWSEDSSIQSATKQKLTYFTSHLDDSSESYRTLPSKNLQIASKISLGPPKPPRQFTSTPNLSDEGVNAETSALSNQEHQSSEHVLNVSVDPSKTIKRSKSLGRDLIDSGALSDIHPRYLGSRSNSSKREPESKHHNDSDDKTIESDVTFNDEQADLPSLEANSVDQSLQEFHLDESLPSEQVNEGQSILSVEDSVENQITHGHSDSAVISNIDLITETEVKDDQSHLLPESVSERDHQNPVQGLEEIYECNAQIENPSSDISVDSPAISLSRSDVPETENSYTKMYFGDSQENMYVDIDSINQERPTSLAEPTSDNVQEKCFQLHNFPQDDSAQSDSLMCISPSTVDRDELQKLVRKLRLALNKERSERLAKERILRQTSQTEKTLHNQLSDMDVKYEEIGKESVAMKSYLEQLRHKSESLEDEASFVLNSLVETNSILSSTEMEKQNLAVEAAINEMKMNSLQNELVLHQSLSSTYRDNLSLSKPADRLLVSMSTQTESEKQISPEITRENVIQNNLSVKSTHSESPETHLICRQSAAHKEENIGNGINSAAVSIECQTDFECGTDLPKNDQPNPEAVMESFVSKSNENLELLFTVLRKDLVNHIDEILPKALPNQSKQPTEWEELKENLDALQKNFTDCVVRYGDEGLAEIKSDKKLLINSINNVTDVLNANQKQLESLDPIQDVLTQNSLSINNMKEASTKTSSELAQVINVLSSLETQKNVENQKNINHLDHSFGSQTNNIEAIVRQSIACIESRLEVMQTQLQNIIQTCPKSEDIHQTLTEFTNEHNKEIVDVSCSKLDQVGNTLMASQQQVQDALNQNFSVTLNTLNETVDENFQIVLDTLQEVEQNIFNKVSEMGQTKISNPQQEELVAIRTHLDYLRKQITKINGSLDQILRMKTPIESNLVEAIRGGNDQALLAIKSQVQCLETNVGTLQNTFQQSNDILHDALLKTQEKNSRLTDQIAQLKLDNQRFEHELFVKEKCKTTVQHQDTQTAHGNAKRDCIDHSSGTVDSQPTRSEQKAEILAPIPCPSKCVSETAVQTIDVETAKCNCDITNKRLLEIQEERDSFDQELKVKRKICKTMQCRMSELEVDINELEEELLLKNTEVIRLKKSSSNYQKELIECRQGLSNFAEIQNKNFTLCQKLRESQTAEASNRLVIESLKQSLSDLSKEKIDLLEQMSSLRQQNAIHERNSDENQSVAQNSNQDLQQQMQVMYTKISDKYLPKSELDSLYMEIESHFESVMNRKLKELNDVISLKFDQHPTNTVPAAADIPTETSMESMSSKMVALKAEILDLHSKINMANEDKHTWQSRYNHVVDRYEKIQLEADQEETSTNSLTESEGDFAVILKEIEMQLKVPYPESPFLAEAAPYPDSDYSSYMHKPTLHDATPQTSYSRSSRSQLLDEVRSNGSPPGTLTFV